LPYLRGFLRATFMAAYETARLLLSMKGIVHGFFMRQGGVSLGPYASLNCSLKVGDEQVDVEENRRRCLQAMGLSDARLFVPSLVHGDGVLVLKDDSSQSGVMECDGDAVITSSRKLALGITYADCLPILLSSRDGHWIAAVHAGWRGVAKNIVRKTVSQMRALCYPSEIVAAIGPSISLKGFAVSGEVREYFCGAWPQFVGEKEKNVCVDLTGIAGQQLLDAGVMHAEKVGGYTDINPERYFSHRRSIGQAGRHIAIISRAASFFS